MDLLSLCQSSNGGETRIVPCDSSESPAGKLPPASLAENQALLRDLGAADKETMQALLAMTLTDRQYYLIKEGGFAAAAFWCPTVSWELAAQLAACPSEAKLVLELAANDAFAAGLTFAERQALQIVAGGYRTETHPALK